ncbi:MAG: HEAT repeat domain-containing protein [Calditrichia bacterium]|nr:HEAT repeat domain-containing protein [Calditrichia bacterium]
MCKYPIQNYLFIFFTTLIPLVMFSCHEKGEVHPWSQVKEVLTISGHTGEVIQAGYTHDGEQIVTVSADSTVRLWDSVSGKMVWIAYGHQGAVRSTFVENNDSTIRTFSDDLTIKKWEKSTGHELSSVTLPPSVDKISSTAFSPDGSLIALGKKGILEIFDTQTGQLVSTLSPFGHPGLRVNTTAIGFGYHPQLIVTGAYSHEVSVWEAFSGRRRLNLHEHGQGCLSAVFSPDMSLIASGSRDQTVIIREARTGIIKKKLDVGWEVRTVYFSPCGTTLFVLENARQGKKSRAIFIDVDSGKQIASLDSLQKTRYVSFSPDASRLLIPSANHVRVFESSVSPKSARSGRNKIAQDLNALLDNAITSDYSEINIYASRMLAESQKDRISILKRTSSALDSDNRIIRKNAILLAAELGKEALDLTEKIIICLRNDEDADVRTAAALALGCMGEESGEELAIPDLINGLSDKDYWVRYHAAHALDKMQTARSDVLSALVEVALNDSSTGLRRQIAFNLGNAGEASLAALPILIEGTKDKDDRKQWWACYTLWCIASGTGEKAASAIPALKNVIRDISDFRDENGGPPRKYAMHALGGIGPVVKKVDPEIVSILRDLMENEDEYYQRKAAALALEKILEKKGFRQKVRGYVRRAPVK